MTTTPLETPEFILRSHVEKTKPTVFDGVLQDLLDAGPDTDGVAFVPSNAVRKYKRELQRAAGNVNRSARILEENDQGDGSTELVFALRDKVTRPRKPKTDA